MAPKPSQPKTTPGNTYRPPGQTNPRIVGRYKKKPTRIKPGLVLKKRGGDLGYVTVRKKKPPKPKATTPGPAAAATPPKIPGPYDTYKETAPWAIPLLEQIDRDQAHQEKYAGRVGTWLSSGLAALTGVDPANPGYNQTAQQQYLANVAGSTGAALNAAAIATPAQVNATTGGGIVQGSNAFLGEAARDASAQRSSAAIQGTQARSALNSIQSNTYAQGAIRAFADLQAGLPQVYAQKRMEQRSKIDEFIATQRQAEAELAEETRSNKVQEAISAQNAQTNAAIQFGRLGLDSEELAADTAPRTGAVPTGYVELPDGRYVRDPTVPSASSARPARPAGNKALTPTQISSMNGKWKRPRNSPPKLGPGWKQPVWDPGTKAWYAKRAPASSGGGGGSSSGSGKPRTATVLEQELVDLYKPGEAGGWEEQFEGRPLEAGKRVAYWVRENKRDFIVSGRRVDTNKLLAVLARIGGNPAKEARRILNGYMTGNPKVWK